MVLEVPASILGRCNTPPAIGTEVPREIRRTDDARIRTQLILGETPRVSL